jgi:hypothetical protein
MIKMISAIKPTTSKMPHTIPALKIPSTTEQLPKPKAKKQTRRKIIDLIPFFVQSLYNYQIAYLFSFTTESHECSKFLRIIGECILHLVKRLLFFHHLDEEPARSYNLNHRLREKDSKVRPQQVHQVFLVAHHFHVLQPSLGQNLRR